MAEAVENAFLTGEHLLVEAGTGTGKSYAYLLPAIDAAVRRKRKVVISTHTISLQEQIVEKDIPLLQSVLGDEFTAVLVKGRGNYLCRRRLDSASRRAHSLFNERQSDALFAVEEWAALGDNPSTDAAKLHDGSLSSAAGAAGHGRVGEGPRRGRQLHGQALQVLQGLLLAGRQAADEQRATCSSSTTRSSSATSRCGWPA